MAKRAVSSGQKKMATTLTGSSSSSTVSVSADLHDIGEIQAIDGLASTGYRRFLRTRAMTGTLSAKNFNSVNSFWKRL